MVARQSGDESGVGGAPGDVQAGDGDVTGHEHAGDGATPTLARREAELRVSRAEFRLLAEQLPGAVFRADADQRLTYVNQGGRHLLAVGGEPVARLRDAVHPGDRRRHDDELAGLAAGPDAATAAYEVRAADGNRVLAVTCGSVHDPLNGTPSYVGALTDVTGTTGPDRSTGRDRLTGLCDRAAVSRHLARVLATDPAGTLVVCVDLDGFHAVNDEWGREAGDGVLAEVAERLGRCVRPEDLVGRYGGDEFAVVVSCAGPDAESLLLHRLAGALAVPVAWPGGWWPPSASFGVARGGPDEEADSLVRRAQLAMREDKRRRRAAG